MKILYVLLRMEITPTIAQQHTNRHFCWFYQMHFPDSRDTCVMNLLLCRYFRVFRDHYAYVSAL